MQKTSRDNSAASASIGTADLISNDTEASPRVSRSNSVRSVSSIGSMTGAITATNIHPQRKLINSSIRTIKNKLEQLTKKKQEKSKREKPILNSDIKNVRDILKQLQDFLKTINGPQLENIVEIKNFSTKLFRKSEIFPEDLELEITNLAGLLNEIGSNVLLPQTQHRPVHGDYYQALHHTLLTLDTLKTLYQDDPNSQVELNKCQKKFEKISTETTHVFIESDADQSHPIEEDTKNRIITEWKNILFTMKFLLQNKKKDDIADNIQLNFNVLNSHILKSTPEVSIEATQAGISTLCSTIHKDSKNALPPLVKQVPFTLSTMLALKAKRYTAALGTIESLLSDFSLPSAHIQSLHSLKKSIAAHAYELGSAAMTEKKTIYNGKITDIIGKPIAKIFMSPLKWIRGKLALRRAVIKFFKTGSFPIKHGVNDRELLEEIIKKVATKKISVFKKSPISSKKVEKSFRYMYIQEQNKSRWKAIIKPEIPIPQEDNSLQNVRSEMTPAGAYGSLFLDPKDPNIKGFSCHNVTETHHCTSLYSTSLYQPDSMEPLFRGYRIGTLSPFLITSKYGKNAPVAEKRKILANIAPTELETFISENPKFSSNEELYNKAWKKIITNKTLPNIKEKIIHNRAKEMIRLAIQSDPRLVQQAKEKKIIDLPFCYLSLMSPFIYQEQGSGLNEHDMVMETKDGLKSLPSQQKIDIHDHETNEIISVTVNAQPIMFSYGVNNVAFDKMMTRAGNRYCHEKNELVCKEGMKKLLGSSELSDMEAVVPQRIKKQEEKETLLNNLHNFMIDPSEKQNIPKFLLNNQEGLNLPKNLQEKLSIAIQNPKLTQEEWGPLIETVKTLSEKQTKKMEIISMLQTKCHEDWNTKAHRRPENVFDTPRQLGVLCYLLDIPFFFGCKSGKDRTSHCDSEIKHLALQLEKGMTLSEIEKAKGSPLEAASLFSLLCNSGNYEVQQDSTALPGYKINCEPVLQRFNAVQDKWKQTVYNGLAYHK